MSSNSKNIIRNEFLKNFTKNIKTRFVLLEKGNRAFRGINQKISRINSKVNLLIQELNLKIHNRQLPYINLMSYYGDIVNNEKVRVFVRNKDTSYFFERKLKYHMEEENGNSHILDLLIAEEYNMITISDLSCDARLVISANDLVNAIVDILLDIIMFNSYSFLKQLSLNEKRKFSGQKYEFYKNKQLESYYICENDDLQYYSLAFSSRKENGSFNTEKYIELWNEFIHHYYPNGIHTEKSILDQLKQHVDYYQLPKRLCKEIATKKSGAYLVLVTNRERTQDIHPDLLSLFGIMKYKKGKTLIRPINEFERFVPLLEHLDVSAFKVVVP